ncbi:MAG: tetratricopeptide repeat protein [Brevinematales bacterium]|nr:tetratricopeptide repeat protein [Brevinematales bacterium]
MREVRKKAWGIGLVLLLSGCNVFSVFNTTDVSQETNVDYLLGLGEYYIQNMEYDKAYEVYSRAVDLEPENAKALEGQATAALYREVPYTNVILAIVKKDSTRISRNGLYRAAGTVCRNMLKIISGGAKGLASNDVQVNTVFFLVGNLYAVFLELDSNGNGNVENDTKDLFILNKDFTVDNNTTNRSFVDLAQAGIVFQKRRATILVLLSYSDVSLSNIMGQLVSEQTKNLFGSLTEGFSAIRSSVEEILAMSASATNLLGTNNPDQVTNLIVQGGYPQNPAGYTAFTNDLAQAGITNWHEVTNAFPDLVGGLDAISNYFGL